MYDDDDDDDDINDDDGDDDIEGSMDTDQNAAQKKWSKLVMTSQKSRYYYWIKTLLFFLNCYIFAKLLPRFNILILLLIQI